MGKTNTHSNEPTMLNSHEIPWNKEKSVALWFPSKEPQSLKSPSLVQTIDQDCLLSGCKHGYVHHSTWVCFVVESFLCCCCCFCSFFFLFFFLFFSFYVHSSTCPNRATVIKYCPHDGKWSSVCSVLIKQHGDNRDLMYCAIKMLLRYTQGDPMTGNGSPGDPH